MLDSLNQRQRLFIFYYSQGKSITSATVEAGYTSKKASAAVIGSRLLRMVKVRKALDTLNEDAGITPSRLVSNLSSVLAKINDYQFKGGDYVKILDFMLKLNGIYLKPPSSPRRPPRKKTYTQPIVNPFIGNFLEAEPEKPIVQTALPIEEQPTEIKEEDKEDKIKNAVPVAIQKAQPSPAPFRELRPAYSLSAFKNQSAESIGSKIYYPA